MKKEQIIRALECCASEENICTECPIDEKIKADCECGKLMSRNALALIKEQDKLIEDYRQTLGVTRVALNNADRDNKQLTKERDRYFDMLCRAVDYATNYEEYTDMTKKAYFGLTDEEYNAVIKYITDNFYEEPDVTEDPSVYDVEINRGKWGFDGLGWSCSCCNEYPVSGQADPHKPTLDTCPNCGAKMDNADKSAKECLFGEGGSK